MMKLGRVLILTASLAVSATVVPSAQNPAPPAPAAAQRTPDEQRDIQTLLQLSDDVVAGRRPAPVDVAVTWDSNHFIRGGDGATYVPFTLRLDTSKLGPAASVYVRVMNKAQLTAAATPPAAPAQGAAPARPTYAWENIYFINAPADGKIQRALAIPPGDYQVLVAVKPKSTAAPVANAPEPPMGVLRHDITIPDFGTGLQTSSVFVIEDIQQLPGALTPQQQSENPYTFGPLRFVLAPDTNFSNADVLHVWFWVYGAQAEAGKPDVQLEYSFYAKAPDGTEKYFNRTAPQALNAMTLPPEFDASMHQLVGELPVPLKAFPAGQYRLEIKITDKRSGQTTTQNVNFAVAA